MPMELKLIVRRAVMRWKGKQVVARKAGNVAAPVPETPAERPVGKGVEDDTVPPAAKLEDDLGRFLSDRYEFRFNRLTGATEFRHKGDAGDAAFRPATARDLNAICMEAHRAGIPCWDRDLARMVNSAHVKAYHPFRQYFDGLPCWDGRDRLHDLAARVSADALWIQAFHRWMLGVAAQWAGLSDGLHAQCVAPLLVSDAQGMGKSTFCRAIMPPELQAYYSDNIDLARPEKIERQLVEAGLLNLDEFDRIPARKHPLLKNLMQLSALNLRKAYQRHACALPRIAAFIGTSNSRELLTDPSGSRRFICVLVEHLIDSTGIDHAQVYAQLKAELLRGERHWFSHEEEAGLQAHNAAFYRVSPASELLGRCFRAARPDEDARLWSLPDLFEHVKRHQPDCVAGLNLAGFAQALTAAGVEKVHTRYGNRWRVVEVDVRG